MLQIPKHQRESTKVNPLMLTDAQCVASALAEFDALGRDAFLKKYGGRKSRDYFLSHNGSSYDSKPIVAAALTRQLQSIKPILCNEFSGGEATVRKALDKLNFVVNKHLPPDPTAYFQSGTAYHRKREIHDVYGGQERGGISTPQSVSAVFLFTGEAGHAHGYHDHWEADGSVFNFYGEGQKGDMRLAKGNLAIADHVRTTKTIWLFTALERKGFYGHVGQFVCVGVARETQTSPERIRRKVLVFQLSPERLNITGSDPVDYEVLTMSLGELRKRALDESGINHRIVDKSATRESVRDRSKWVRAYALARANGICEQCGDNAPFSTKKSKPYLEVHHTHRLADEGPDHPAWVAAICPNCHRRIHFGHDGTERNQALATKITNMEEQAAASSGGDSLKDKQSVIAEESGQVST